MPADQERDWEPPLRTALETGDSALPAMVEDIYAADLADLFPDLNASAQAALLESMRDEHVAELLYELSVEDRQTVLDLLPVERASDVLESMPSDDAADLIGELPTHEADALLERMEPDAAAEVAELLRYSEDTAGGLMVKEFVRLFPDQTVGDALAMLRSQAQDAETIYALYVLDEEERLLGIVTLRSLIVCDPAYEVSEVMRREFVSVTTHLPQEEVAKVVRRHDLLAVPVLDDEGRMQGIITVDDIGDVVTEEAAEDLLEMSGAEETDEDAIPQPLGGWRSGLLALIGGAAGAFLLWIFGRTLVDWMHVAMLLPLLLVLGITMGSQAVLSMDNGYDSAVERHQVRWLFMREALTGALLALAGGILAGVFLFALERSAPLAVAVAIPITAGLWLTAISGAAGALIARQYGEHLGPTAHTTLVIVALLIGLIAYLLFAQWTSVLVLPRPG